LMRSGTPPMANTLTVFGQGRTPHEHWKPQ
jgi:hypothetical protein